MARVFRNRLAQAFNKIHVWTSTDEKDVDTSPTIRSTATVGSQDQPLGSITLSLLGGVAKQTSATRAVDISDPIEQETEIATADVKTLNASPVTLVSARGPGTYVEFLGATLFLDYESAAYDGVAAGEDLAIKYTDGSGIELCTALETTGFIDQANDELRNVVPLTTTTVPVENTPIVLHMLVGEIATGDSPLKVRCRYRVHQSAW